SNCLPLVLTVCARTLRAALDYVSRDCPGREFVPIIGCPAKLMNHWTKGESGVGRATGDDNLRPLIQRLNNWSSAQIGISALNSIADRTQRLVCVHIAQFDSARQEIIYAIKDVITSHDADFDFATKA